MLIITTWKTFLTYGLDLMTKEDCESSVFFIACNQIRYDASSYSGSNSQVIPSRLWWADDVQRCLEDTGRYKKYLDGVVSSPSANAGTLMQMSLLVPCFMFVPDIPRNGVLVRILQEQLHDVFGIGSMWLDGGIFEGEPNIIEQDEQKIKRMFKDHIKHAKKTQFDVRSAPGTIYRDTRLNTLNDMSEGDQRRYLKRKYGTDTDGMDAATVYALMLDLFVEERSEPDSDQLKDAVRDRWKQTKKKKKL